jgi:hypothetical protein
MVCREGYALLKKLGKTFDLRVTAVDVRYARMLEVLFAASGISVGAEGLIDVNVTESQVCVDSAMYTRPVDVRTLIADVRERLTRYNADGVGEFVVNETTRTAFCRGNEILLTSREFELLHYLFVNRGRAVSRVEIAANVWRSDLTGETNIVDVYIRYLREKIDDRFNYKLIYTVRNKGYMIKGAL